MKRALYAVLALVVVGYVGVCGFMYARQRSLLCYPLPRSVTAPQSTMRLPVDGAQLVVTVRPHAGPKAIIYFGGNNEDVSGSLAPFAEWFPDHALFLLHYRGHGGSTGQPTEESNHADAAVLFKTVRARHSDVALIGRSLGSGVAVRLASEQPASRLILVTPYASIQEIAEAQYPYLPVSWLLVDKYQSWRYAPGIKIPTTIIAAANDRNIPRRQHRTLVLAIRQGRGLDDRHSGGRPQRRGSQASVPRGAPGRALARLRAAPVPPTRRGRPRRAAPAPRVASSP